MYKSNIINIKKNLKKIVDIINEYGQITDGNIIQRPYFNTNDSKKYIKKENELSLEQYSFLEHLPIYLQYIYSVVESKEELIINHFTFFSLNNLIERNNLYKYNIDLGLIYLGMGHILALSYSITKKKFFWKRDGGSNYYDRKEYYDFYENYNLEDKYAKKFIECFNNISENKLPDNVVTISVDT